VGRLSRTVRAALPVAALLLAPAAAPAQGPPHPMPPGSAPPQHSAAPLPFYRERTFLVLVGLAAAGSGALAYRVVQRRRRTPAGFVSEAVLVVDLVDSTHLATHHGESVAMRARNALKERTLVAARRHGMVFAENTGDGYFMTLPSVTAAARIALELLAGLREAPPDVAPAPPLAVRVGLSYGEILLDAHGGRHGATINKAFRLVGVPRESFARVEGAGGDPEAIPDRDRVFLDEEAARELRDAAFAHRFVGFCSLKGFPGLHRVFALEGEAPRPATRSGS